MVVRLTCARTTLSFEVAKQWLIGKPHGSLTGFGTTHSEHSPSKNVHAPLKRRVIQRKKRIPKCAGNIFLIIYSLSSNDLIHVQLGYWKHRCFRTEVHQSQGISSAVKPIYKFTHVRHTSVCKPNHMQKSNCPP